MWQYWLAFFLYAIGGIWRTVGNLASSRGAFRGAVWWFDQALRLDPSLTVARRDRGILLWRELARPEEALAAFDELLAENGEDALSLLNRAFVYEATGRFPQALADLDAFLALPTDESTYRDIARRTATLLRELLDEDQRT